jgi:hypothetical protein
LHPAQYGADFCAQLALSGEIRDIRQSPYFSARSLDLCAQQFAQCCSRATQLFIAGQAIGTETKPLAARVANDTLTLQSGWKLRRLCKADGEKCSVVLIASVHRVYTGIGEVSM